MPQPTLIALDLGTTGNRALAFGPDLSLLAQAYKEMPLSFPQPGWVEHDPEEIWQGATGCLAQVESAIPPGSLVGIGITNQRETTVVWEKKTGKPIYPAIVWQCRRTAKACQALKEQEGSIREKTGLVLDPYFSATKLAWILDTVPGARARAQAGELCFGTVDTWVVWRLTGGAVHASDPSNASRTLLYDLKARAWDPELCRLFNVPMQVLPELRGSDTGFGSVAAPNPCAGAPILAVLGDQQASLFAHGGWRHGLAKATFGTGIFLMQGTGEERPLLPGILTTSAWSLSGSHSHALEGSIFMGGATLQWLRDSLGVLSKASESEALAASLPSNEGVYLVPAFQGLGAPHWDATARGAILGLSRASTRAHVARAALEAQAYQVRELMELFETRTGPLRSLRVDGGATANAFLMQFLADQLNATVERPQMLETTALGAAGLAGLAAGLWDLEGFLERQGPCRRFEPGPGRGSAQGDFDRWKEAVGRSRNWPAH